jgi:hypothetical protein
MKSTRFGTQDMDTKRMKKTLTVGYGVRVSCGLLIAAADFNRYPLFQSAIITSPNHIKVKSSRRNQQKRKGYDRIASGEGRFPKGRG